MNSLLFPLFFFFGISARLPGLSHNQVSDLFRLSLSKAARRRRSRPKAWQLALVIGKTLTEMISNRHNVDKYIFSLWLFWTDETLKVKHHSRRLALQLG